MLEKRVEEETVKKMAIKLLAKGIPPDIIAQSADLPVEVIQNLMI